MTTDLALPLDNAAIERILPHRYPFLLVDKITEFEEEKLPYFLGIERLRYLQPVRPGDVVVIEATVERLRSRMGQLRGSARVRGEVVLEGTMRFALGPRKEGSVDG